MKIIAANWKMNHAFEEADSWLKVFSKLVFENKDQLSEVESVVCPPVFMIDYIDSELMDNGFRKLEAIVKSQNRNIDSFTEEELSEIILKERPIKIGGQDCHFEDYGSFTGDISASSLKKIGCEYVILGHSERRAGHFENNKIVAKKVTAALKQNLTPIICVGESKEIRDQSKHLEFVYKQVMNSVPQDLKFEKLIIAYEPIWSIGTGVVPTAEQIREMAKLIKKIFAEKLNGIASQYFMLYGGSVTSQNSADILKIENVNGLLVGKASLDAEEFFKICVS
ncbi:MAG: triose-phosphate isomerase [Pelagibacterales bacterium]|nr:triose-phosphate isomerase [Pelagibacterales bacterium]